MAMGHLEAELKDMYLEQGREQGIQQGIEQGIEISKMEIADRIIKLRSCSLDEALKIVNMRHEDYERVKNSLKSPTAKQDNIKENVL